MEVVYQDFLPFLTCCINIGVNDVHWGFSCGITIESMRECASITMVGLMKIVAPIGVYGITKADGEVAVREIIPWNHKS